jgi:hypothetical protein
VTHCIIAKQTGSPSSVEDLNVDGSQDTGIDAVALIKERNDKQVKIDWQFSVEAARDKMNKHYQKVFAGNSKYQKA